MRNYRTISFVMAVILFSSLFFSCQKDGNDPVVTDNEVSFAINVSNLKSAAHLKSTTAYSLTDADKIILTIQNSDGSPTKYTSAEVNIEIMNGQYYTKKIVLKNGSYNLTEFLVVDQTGNTILAIPSSGSLMAQNVALSLPIAFSSSKDNTTPVNVEVLSTETKTPEDFGLNRFPIAEVKTFSFLIGVADSETDELLSAVLTVSNGSYAYNQDLDASMSNVVTVKDDLSEYTLTVVKTGYNTYNETHSIESLKLHSNDVGNLPLLVELETTLTAFVIGQNYGGGVVAYILQPGDLGYIEGETHGLIAASSDQSTNIVWWNGSYTITGATATALGTGNTNTNIIVSSQGAAGNYAAKLCYDLELGGYSDWYLPSKFELYLLYSNIGQGAASPNTNVGGFSNTDYWSSTEAAFNGAWYQQFNDGLQSTLTKVSQRPVRAVRSF